MNVDGTRWLQQRQHGQQVLPILKAATAKPSLPKQPRPTIDADKQSVVPVMHRVFGMWDPKFRVPGDKGHMPLRPHIINMLLPQPYRAFANAWETDLPQPWIQMLWDQYGAAVMGGCSKSCEGGFFLKKKKNSG